MPYVEFNIKTPHATQLSTELRQLAALLEAGAPAATVLRHFDCELRGALLNVILTDREQQALPYDLGEPPYPLPDVPPAANRTAGQNPAVADSQGIFGRRSGQVDG